MFLISDTIAMIKDIDRSSRLFGFWGKMLNIPQVIGGIVFISEIEAILILITCAFPVIIAAQIHKKAPFSRLTSIVHILWLPLFPWLIWTLMETGVHDLYTGWMTYVVVVIGLSLIMDVRNILLYRFSKDQKFKVAHS